MNDEIKITLSDEERENLIEKAANVHQIVEAISNKKKRNKWEMFFRHPLLILLIGSIISGVVIFRFQDCHTKNSEQIKARYALMGETSLYLGKVLAWADNLVYNHEKPITNDEQLKKTNREYNEAFDDFKSNYFKISFKLKIVFEDENIDKQWELIQKGTIELNELIDLMGKFKTDEQDIEHSARISWCKKKILEIKYNLDKLSGFMVQEIK